MIRAFVLFLLRTIPVHSYNYFSAIQSQCFSMAEQPVIDITMDNLDSIRT